MTQPKINRAIGVDLGTTNSAAAILSPAGEALFLASDRLGRKTIPSVLGWEPDRARFNVGHRAWNRRQLSPHPVESIKRKMGSQTALIVGEYELMPEEISAKILAHLVDEMRAFSDGSKGTYPPEELKDVAEIDRAVITVPAYFDAPQIEATRRAGELAGLEVLGLLQEPTAAAIYYAFKHSIGDGNFLVYDLGGGTFDVSIIRCLAGEYQVLATDGDNFLGGDDFDRALAEKFRQFLVGQGYQLDLNIAEDDEDRVRFVLLEHIAREVKEALTNSEVEYVGRRDIFKDQAGQAVTLDLEVSREEFNALITPLLEPSLEACSRALERANERAGIGLEDLRSVLLVGGSTRIPLVQQLIERRFCDDLGPDAPQMLIDEPDTCVALGAAIQAANLGGAQFIQAARADDALRLSVTSALSSRQAEYFIDGFFSGALPDGAEIATLIDKTGRVIASNKLRHTDDLKLYFELNEIPLTHPGRHEFKLEIHDQGGAALARFDVFLERLPDGAPYRPTGSALSNPSVLAKDIYLEVNADSTPTRHLLIERGESLPFKKSFQFYTADRSGAVLLRLFQERFPIKSVHIEIAPETPLNTPVDLAIEIDETMTMLASGSIEGEAFVAKIEAPAPPELKNWPQIDALLAQAEEIHQKLWGLEKINFTRQVDPLISGIRETARTDPDKLQVLARRLEGVLEDYFSRKAKMTPAYSRYTALLNAVKRVVYRDTSKQPLGRTIDAWHQYLEELEARAESAWAERDHNAWQHIFDQVQAVWESLAQDEYLFLSKSSPEYILRVYLGLMRQTEQMKTALDEFVVAKDEQTQNMQRREIMRLNADIEDELEDRLRALDLDAPTHELKPQLARLSEVAARMDRRLEELATLGLVRR